ncbi:MAG: NADH:flavin oxidoreductase [Chloroflexi bacterium]|nr:NADH:flavin oxidoreductase [Chloroflexota bacterium]
MSFEMLFSPLTVNRMELPNRIVLAPMQDYLASEDGFITSEVIDLYLRCARGGVGMLVLGAMPVSSKRTARHKCIWDDKFIPGLRDLADRIHSQTDARICAQLLEKLTGPLDLIPDIESVSDEEIKQIIDDHGKAALRAKEAGFDAIALHAAHSHALATFLSLTNKRKDEYGGPVQRRTKIVAEIYQRIRQTVGEDYPVGIRINGDDFIVGGNTLLHTRIIAIKLAKMGFDYISLSAGAKLEDIPGLIPVGGRLIPYPPVGGYSGLRCVPPASMPEGVNVYLAEDIRTLLRQAGYSTPVMTAGRIPYPELAEAILAEGKADLIGLSRPLLRDVDWPIKAQEGRAKDIARCEYCNTCVQGLFEGQGPYCKHEKR